jgi:hypothetical protein
LWNWSLYAPLYLGNIKRYNKSVGIHWTGIFLKNLIYNKADIYISYLCVDKENYLFYLGKWDKGGKIPEFHIFRKFT